VRSTGGAGATGAIGGASGTDGTGADGGDGAMGGAGAIGGAGVAGTGGTDGTGMGGVGTGGGPGGAGGSGHHGGTGGSNHVPDCSSFPSGSSFVTPTDGLLHCYWTHAEQLYWLSSDSTCVNEKGTLATILSPQENSFLVNLLSRPNLFFSPGSGVSLGATDGKSMTDPTGAGNYAWVTGEPWGYQPWHMEQPDGSCNMCGAPSNCGCDHWLVLTKDGTWFDRSEVTPRPFVCEATAR
ncbi:MAG TPA: C-type lectin domain-containing protein, partial [Polyangia bacterium]|nr:C-type lectin domain-containing protein [Polyangia bacterium]